MRTLVLVLFMAVTITLGGAATAGKKTPTNKEKIVGTWKGALDFKTERIEFGTITFRDDGKFTLERDHFLDLAKGTYAMDGDALKVTITYAVDGAPMEEGSWPAKVKSLSEKELVLELKGENTTALIHFAKVIVAEGAWKAVDEDRKKLQGSWEYVRSEVGGKIFIENEPETMTFDGEKVLVKSEGEHGIFTLSANRKLKVIQFRWGEGKGLANLSAYELKGDTLRLCWNLDRGFPGEFKTEGTKNRIVEFKRVKK